MNTQSMKNFLVDWFSINLTYFTQVTIIATFRHISQEVDIGSAEISSIQNEEILLELANIVRDEISIEMKKCRVFSRLNLKSRRFYSLDGVEISTKNFCDLIIKIGIGGEILILIRDSWCRCIFKIEKASNRRVEEINKLLLRFSGLC